jgi:nitrite reductase/ring-hydroxylating ferredoxin subunit
MKSFYICNENEVNQSLSFIKYIEEIKDEIILFYDSDQNLKCFSSVCPHMAGEIIIKNKALFCKWHGLAFNNDGKCTNSHLKLLLREYQLNIKEKKVYLECDE